MDYSIYTIGGFDIFVSVFNQIASLLRSNGGSIYAPMVMIATAIALFYGVVSVIFAGQVMPLGTWFVSYFIILNGLMAPLASVVIKDTMTGQFRKIDNVPFGLAFVASNLSSLGYHITKATEQAFQPPPRYGSGNQGGQQPGDFASMSYTSTGFIFGAHAIAQMKSVAIPDDDLADNLHEFVNQCVVYDIANGNKYTRHDVMRSSNIWKLVSEKASKIRGFAWREVTRRNGSITGSPETKIITCAEGVAKINNIWADTTQSVLSKIASGLIGGLGFGGSSSGADVLNMQVSSSLPGALNKLTGSASAASDRIKQQIMISSVIKADELKKVELGGSANFDVRRAYLQQRSSFKTIGETVAQTLPALKNVLEALIYCLFIFVLPLSLLPQGWKMIGFWAKACLWVQLWAPLFAIINSIATESMTSQILNRVTAEGGFSIANFVGIENASSDMAAIAGYICSIIPVLSWSIVERGGYAFVNMASSLMGVSQGAATSAANEGFSGNYSFGNVSMGGVQADNTSMLKNDSSASYSAGHMAINDGSSSRIISADGGQILKIDSSQYPMELRSAEAQEETLRNSYNSAMSIQEAEGQNASIMRAQAEKDGLEFTKQASHHVADIGTWGNAQTASGSREASESYGKIKNIADNFNINKELVSQAAVAASAGVDVNAGFLGGLIGINARAGVDVSKSQISSSHLTAAADQINQLGKSDDFRAALHSGKDFSKANNVEAGNQDMKQAALNFGDSFEKSQQHQHNASVAFDRAKSLSNEMSHLRSNTKSINMNENQRYLDEHIDKGGNLDQIEHMSRHDLPKLKQTGDQYMAEHYPTRSLPMNERSMKDHYGKASNTFENNHQVHRDTTRVQGMADKAGVSPDRGLDIKPKTAHVEQQQGVIMARIQKESIERKRATNGAQNNFAGKVDTHSKGELGVIQQATAKKMQDRNIKNAR